LLELFPLIQVIDQSKLSHLLLKLNIDNISNYNKFLCDIINNKVNIWNNVSHPFSRVNYTEQTFLFLKRGIHVNGLVTGLLS
jgi:hypothetical protein